MISVYVPLHKEEIEKISELARMNRRKPAEQAALLISESLTRLEDTPGSANV